jgi:antitoxin component of MazEF toxin-antitoxin module
MSTTVVHTSEIAQLRAKNQLTLPDAIVKEVGAEKGDRFRVAVEDGVIRLIPLRKSYYGAFRGLWPDNWMEELRKERDEWSRREIW